MTITLATVSNINHPLVEFSVNRACETHRFDKIKVWADQPMPGINYRHDYYNIDDFIAPYDVTTGAKIPFNFDLYNEFLLKHMVKFIDTEFVVSIQYDGFCTNSSNWSDEFLEYDYIASPTMRDWPPLQATLRAHDLYDLAPSGWYNGCGGLSLRSRRLLMALQDPVVSPFLSDRNYERCEDVTIAVKYRQYLEQEYHIRFAPVEVAFRFCTELLTGLDSSWGFHGWDNTPLFLTENECIWYIDRLNRKGIYRGSLPVRRYLAACVVRGYDHAIDHMDQLLNDAAALAARESKYSR